MTVVQRGASIAGHPFHALLAVPGRRPAEATEHQQSALAAGGPTPSTSSHTSGSPPGIDRTDHTPPASTPAHGSDTGHRSASANTNGRAHHRPPPPDPRGAAGSPVAERDRERTATAASDDPGRADSEGSAPPRNGRAPLTAAAPQPGESGVVRRRRANPTRTSCAAHANCANDSSKIATIGRTDRDRSAARVHATAARRSRPAATVRARGGGDRARRRGPGAARRPTRVPTGPRGGRSAQAGSGADLVTPLPAAARELPSEESRDTGAVGSRSDVEAAKAAARRFLTGYLPYSYGQADARHIDATSNELRHRLASDPPRVPPGRGDRRPRVQLVHAEGAGRVRRDRRARLRRCTALHGQARVERRRSGWIVVDVGADHGRRRWPPPRDLWSPGASLAADSRPSCSRCWPAWR